MEQYVLIGAVLGASAGVSPGPLLTLVISETLVHDIRSGIKVAMAPLVTDVPIIGLTLFVLSRLSGFNNVLGMVSLVGGAVVMTMGVQSIRTRGITMDMSKRRPQSLIKGVLVNFLSPHPYLFWLSVGTPIMMRAKAQHLLSAVAFVLGFYVLLVGSKIFLAVLVGKSKRFLTGRAYIYTLRFLGCLLCLLSIFLFKEGCHLLGLG